MESSRGGHASVRVLSHHLVVPPTYLYDASCYVASFRARSSLVALASLLLTVRYPFQVLRC
jgi:hypothetical protein